MHDRPVIPWLTREQVYEKLVSYAQNHEDVLLHRAFRDQAAGFYVDIGANDPVFHSVTKLFYDRGWSGLNVEPNPAVYRTLQEGRPRDVNLNIGVSDREGTLTFYEVPAIHGWSTFMPDLAERFRRQGLEVVERPVAVTTLVRLCERHVDRTIDFLKVDAEGS
ncbi:MAG: FkbM family methyltransferase, partial [Isosphaeraceae bacterium]